MRASRVVTHRELRDYLAERGYEVLDSKGLQRFLSARLADRSPSVVVFSMDHLPPTVAPVAADTVLFRRYLDAGGKVVWPGIPPLIWPRDPETGEGSDYIRIDRAGTARLLGCGPRPEQLRQLRGGRDRGGAPLGIVGVVGQQLGRRSRRGDRDAGPGRQRPRQLLGQELRRTAGYGVREGVRRQLVRRRPHGELRRRAGGGGVPAALHRPVERRIARAGPELGLPPPIPAAPELEVPLVQDPAGERRGPLLLDLPEQHLGAHLGGRLPDPGLQLRVRSANSGFSLASRAVNSI